MTRRKAWHDAVGVVLPYAAPRVIGRVADRWAGANIYLPLRVARLRRPRAPHRGAAEHFAADMHAAVLDVGGTTADARVVLTSLAGRRFVV